MRKPTAILGALLTVAALAVAAPASAVDSIGDNYDLGPNTQAGQDPSTPGGYDGYTGGSSESGDITLQGGLRIVTWKAQDVSTLSCVMTFTRYNITGHYYLYQTTHYQLGIDQYARPYHRAQYTTMYVGDSGNNPIGGASNNSGVYRVQTSMYLNAVYQGRRLDQNNLANWGGYSFGKTPDFWIPSANMPVEYNGAPLNPWVSTAWTVRTVDAVIVNTRSSGELFAAGSQSPSFPGDARFGSCSTKTFSPYSGQA